MKLLTSHYGHTVEWSFREEDRDLARYLLRFRARGRPRLSVRVERGPWCAQPPLMRAPDPETLALRASYWLRERLVFADQKHLVLHAAALEAPWGGILLLGDPGAGKTTVARALSDRWGLLGEDASLVDLGSGLLVPELPMSFIPRRWGRPAKPKALIFLAYSPEASFEAKALSPPEVAVGLARGAFNLATLGGRGLDAIAKLTENRAWRLRFGRLEDALGFIQGLG